MSTAAGEVFCPPDCSWEPVTCMLPNCARWTQQCNRWCEKGSGGRACEPNEMAVNRTMTVIRDHMPAPPVQQASTPRLLLLTVAFPHALQLLKLSHCARVISSVPNALWLVGEDAATKTAEVVELLRASALPHRHIAIGPTRKGGNTQRNALLELIKREALEGIVFNMDDDNAYHPDLWPELRRLRPMRVGVVGLRRSVWPPPPCNGVHVALPFAGFLTRKQLIERPTYDNQTGRFLGFAAGWCDPRLWLSVNLGHRTFCVDMGAFVFDAHLLQHVGSPLWSYTGHGGENEFISKLLPGGLPEDLQPLANCGQDLLVFHNEYRTVPIAVQRHLYHNKPEYIP